MYGDILNVKTDTLEFKAADAQASNELKKRIHDTLSHAPEIDGTSTFWPGLVRIDHSEGSYNYTFRSYACDSGLHKLIQDIPGYVTRWNVCADLESNLVSNFRSDHVVSRGLHFYHGFPVETHVWYPDTDCSVRLYRVDHLFGGPPLTRLEIEKRTNKIGIKTTAFWCPVVTPNIVEHKRIINKFWSNIINKIENCYYNDLHLCPGRGIPDIS